jgi:hypothetical protein
MQLKNSGIMKRIEFRNMPASGRLYKLTLKDDRMKIDIDV